MAALFTIFELLNLKTHLILKSLRKQGSTDRGIPRGWGFNQVSCANYLGKHVHGLRLLFYPKCGALGSF